MAANKEIGILLLLVSSMLFLCLLFPNGEDNFVGKNSNDTKTVFSFIHASIVAVPVTIFYAYWNWISVQFLRHSWWVVFGEGFTVLPKKRERDSGVAQGWCISLCGFLCRWWCAFCREDPFIRDVTGTIKIFFLSLSLSYIFKEKFSIACTSDIWTFDS